MEQFIDFTQDRWLFILVAIIGIFIVFKIVKSMIKWLLVIAIVAVLIIYGSNYIAVS